MNNCYLNILFFFKNVCEAIQLIILRLLNLCGRGGDSTVLCVCIVSLGLYFDRYSKRKKSLCRCVFVRIYSILRETRGNTFQACVCVFASACLCVSVCLFTGFLPLSGAEERR